MKSLKIFAAAILCLGAFAACEKEPINNGSKPEMKVVEAQPASLFVSFEVPAKTDLFDTKAVENRECEIEELAVVMFQVPIPGERPGGRIEVIDLTGMLRQAEAGSNENKGYSLYKINADRYYSHTLSGLYHAYAIANWTSPYSNLNINPNSWHQQFAGVNGVPSEEEFLAMLKTSAGNVYGLDLMPMYGRVRNSYIDGHDGSKVFNGYIDADGNKWEDCYYIRPDEELEEQAPVGDPEHDCSLHDRTNELRFTLTRLTSHIEFNFSVDKTDGDSSRAFTPKRVEVYNLPKVAGFVDSNLNGTEYMPKQEFTVSTSSFKFYMLENKKTATAADWNARIANIKADGPLANSATYVKVTGEYVDSHWIGDVSYLIPLGNTSSEGGSMSNYNVNRNEWHHYNITVKGVNSILVDCGISGATGTINQAVVDADIDAIENAFLLDSHYEQVMVKLTQSQIDNLKQDGISVKIISPKGNVDTHTNAADFATSDYKWLQFQKPTAYDKFPIYAGINADGTCANVGGRTWVYVDQFAQHPEYYCVTNTEGGKTYYYTTVFVDEYVYPDLPMNQYVNGDRRQIVMGRTLSQSSHGTGSQVSTGAAIYITQRALATSWDINTAIEKDWTIFGIETWDEWTGFSRSYTNDSNLSYNNGYNNSKLLRANTDNQLSDTWYETAGYLKNVTDNSANSHRWDGGTKPSTVDNQFKNVLARNRDLNGNGVIDENEMKWYMPSLLQYQIIFLGEDVIPEDTRLINPADLYSPGIANGAGCYDCSSGSGYNAYWADEGASYGTGGNNAKNRVRAVRSIKNLTDVVTSECSTPFKVDKNARTITVYLDGIRRVKQTTPHAFHRERDEADKLPAKFQVRATDLGAYTVNDSNRNNLSQNSQTNPADKLDAFVFNNADKRALKDEGWRIPNLKEFMLMDICNTVFNGGLLNNDRRYMTCTWYSNRLARTNSGQTNTYDKPYPYVKATYITLPYRNAVLNDYYVALVKDAD